MRARSRPSSVSFHALPLLGLLALGACTLEPAGTGPEFRRLDLAAGAGGWQQPREDRALPDLPDPPSAEDVVARALLANGALEADWHAWRAALERVLVASGWPNTDLALGLTRFLEHGGVWDTSAVSLGFDPMQMLLLPDKVRQAGEVAFREALAAGRRFESSRVALRERALLAWWDWALLGEKLVVQERRVALLDALQRSASATVAVGGSLSALSRVQLDAGMARVALDELHASVPAGRAALNALLARAPDAPLALPPHGAPDDDGALPSDESVLVAGLAANPELAELGALAEAREQALDLAGRRREPNLAPSVQAAGGSAESVGLMLTFPATVPAVAAAVRAARADLDEARARQVQGGLDARAALLAALATLHNDEHRLVRLRDEIVPAARALLDNARVAYATGRADLAAWVEASNAVLDVDLLAAEARAARAQHLAALERLAGTRFRGAPPADGAPPSTAGDQP